ncbi:esterase/lipase family protein [Ferrimonas gelatinilytica]|uniref:Triacylglycerol lipase n=1 Tax=Ferrimonas gelatinilytica TaxID=1255257 RepID=A0ABP9S737_9GAMM
MGKKKRNKVLLLHGLYMHGSVMWPLAQRLKQREWETECLSYNSVAIRAESLYDRILSALPQDQPAYLVGHSLGGVLLYHLAHAVPLPLGSRIVTLGSPLQGALLARRLAQWNLSALLGNAGEHGLLRDQPVVWHSDAALGSLAGGTGFGMGTLLGAPRRDSDGTVLIEETRIAGMRDHKVLPVTHTSMLLSAEVARQTDQFLRYGYFDQSDCSKR